MYSWEKPLREDKPRKNPRKPSFSSTLLDEILNSIDGNDQKSEDSKVYKEKPTKKHGGGRAKSGSREDEEMANLRREKEINDKIIARRRAELENIWLQEHDLMFFSSNSSSSDSSGALSSSDSEFFGVSNSTKSRTSCFSTPKLKPVRTNGRGREDHLLHSKNEDFLYKNKQDDKADDNLIKSKSRAMKIYANLNKIKQPISPGARLTNFINSLFANSKKNKKCTPSGVFEDSNMESKSKSQQGSSYSSTCSSASSFSRSCLINNSSRSTEKTGVGNKRTVTFSTVNAIADERSNPPPHGYKSVKKSEVSDKFGRPPLPPTFLPDSKFTTRERRIQDSTRDFSKAYHNQRKDDFSMFRSSRCKVQDFDDDEEDLDDAASDSSSELFELDHLALFGNKKFSEELPVYETTHFDPNHAIASSLIRKL